MVPMDISTNIKGGGGYFTKLLVRGDQSAMKKWTPSDLMLWKNEGSKRSKNNKKGVN